MSKKLVFVLALALAPLAANALGLGEIKLNSALNQPLSADIMVVSAAPDEISSLHVKLASAAQFQQAGIPMSNALSQLQFQVVPGANGTATIHISSSQPFREPFLDVLLDVTWDNGELIREYTVFLNPPNFESTTQSAPASAPSASAAPVTAPAPSSVAPATVAAPAVAAPTAPVPAVVPSGAASMAIPSTQTQLGGNYGPIHRGETLSEIALKLRPQGVTLNQMMIAIYRANPEVFMHNINLMKAGYVLRVPNADDIQAVQVADANAEVRTQIAEWRSQRGLASAHPAKRVPTGEQPSLTLVAPSSAAQTAENQVPGSGKGATSVSSANGAGTSQALAAATTAKAPIMLASSGLAAVQAQASKTNQKSAITKVTPLPSEKPTVTKPLPKFRFKAPVQTQPAESGGLLSSLFNPYVIILIIIVIVLVIIGMIMRKKRNAASALGKPIKSKGKASPAPSLDWEKEEKAGLRDVTAAPVLDKHEVSATSAKDAVGAASGAAVLSTTTTIKTNEPDPLAESDFHMAYGLYDQAAEVLKKGLAQDPGRRDLKLKLLEVYFTAGDRANFIEVARGLRQDMGATPDKDWEKVAIMGRQVAADDPLFSGGAAAPGATTASVDIPLDSGGTGTAVHTDLDPLAGAFEGVRPVVVSEVTGIKPAEDKHVVDFALPDLEPAPLKAKSGAKPAEPVPAGAGATPKTSKVGVTTVTADFGTDSQVEFDKALKELSDFVNTNVPPQDEGARSGAALSLAADADLDVSRPVVGTTTATGAAARAGEETTGLNEIGTKLDLARAYIDMGDAEGAKNILTEVLEEGDSQQKQEAQKLMQQLG